MTFKLPLVCITPLVAVLLSTVQASHDYYKPQDFDLSSFIWARGLLDNSSLNNPSSMGCSFCGEFFFSEPPPEDALIMPPPPMHPSFRSSILEASLIAKGQPGESCSFCRAITGEIIKPEYEHIADQLNNRVITLLVAFIAISAILVIYFISTRRTRIIASLSHGRTFKSNHPMNSNHQPDKSRSLNDSIANSDAHLADPCFFQSGQNKNLTSPIISDSSTHKKTSIPSKYWAQPGSIIGRTVRRIPNEYEFPSSRTNSTGTSSAVYADMNNENNQRFFSPYSLHTYAEVREVLDPNEHIHTSSNSSVMLSESNYDNTISPHNNVAVGLNGSVQMSDFNSARSAYQAGCKQMGTSTMLQHHNNQVYEHPPQRAQIIITSNNQGMTPTLLNYKERIHNVI